VGQPLSAIGRRPPGPKNPPLVGHLPAFRRDPISFLLNLTREYGDAAYFRLAGQQMYFFNHPDLIREVLVTQQARFRKSRVLQRAKVLLGEGLLTSHGPVHLRQRRLIQPAFHHDRLVRYASVMTDAAQRVSDRWQDGATLDVSSEMMRLTLDVVARTLFSAEMDVQAAEIGAAMTDVLELFETILLPFSELLEKLPLPASRRFRAARERLDAIIFRLIEERRAGGEDRGDLLSMLILVQDEAGDGAGMTNQQVRDEALTLFLAGHETTANALTWAWYLLSQKPEAERRLHAELDAALHGRAPEFDDLPRLRYTEMVLAESMRLYPPAWAIARMALEDCQIGDYAVPKDAIVVMSQYIMHRNPRYWPEAERFDPERFLPEALEARPKFAYFPFGGGPRVCIGERFAWMEGVLALATLAQRWRLRLAEGHAVAIRPLITLRPRFGMKMTASVRSL
jgi:cytochrome P450